MMMQPPQVTPKFNRDMVMKLPWERGGSLILQQQDQSPVFEDQITKDQNEEGMLEEVLKIPYNPIDFHKHHNRNKSVDRVTFFPNKQTSLNIEDSKTDNQLDDGISAMEKHSY